MLISSGEREREVRKRMAIIILESPVSPFPSPLSLSRIFTEDVRKKTLLNQV